MLRSALPSALLTLAIAGCGRGDASPVARPREPGPRPDEQPALVTTELPFRYPAELYARHAQGNVTLRLFIDRDGHVAPDSIQVAEPSAFAAFDSAAVRGAAALRFVPAKLRGEPVATSVLFPVFFRHPEAKPLPGDTVLK
ncbi:MAG TPA: TonB family protein [Gemmatimonadaceae bacterium]|nr:TonB family protein [Gemmatimonadaceae bacterium]